MGKSLDQANFTPHLCAIEHRFGRQQSHHANLPLRAVCGPASGDSRGNLAKPARPVSRTSPIATVLTRE
jgi:hypothetical protein